MKIYNLKDAATESDVAESKRLVVSDLKQGLKNPDRVNVFVDGKFLFSLDISQVVDYKLKVGKQISEEELDELKRASEFGKLYQRALEWVLARPRSEKETRDYLYKKIFEKKLDKKYIDEIVGKLKDKKYLDDQKFAEWWVENRFVNKGVSSKRLRMELLKKGISNSVVDEVLDARDDDEEIMKIIAKKRARYADDEKLMAYLIRQGFPFELVKEKIRLYETDSQNLE